MLGIQSAYSAGIGYVSELIPEIVTDNLNSINNDLYLPLITNNDWGSQERRVPTVHVPYFQDEIHFEQTAIFWFGHVTPIDNYADVRIGYTSQFLYIRLGVFDRLLWYDTQPSPETLQSWDAIDLLLKVNTIGSNIIDQYSYRFVGQLNWWEDDRDKWQTSYQGNGAGWDENTFDWIRFEKTGYRQGLWGGQDARAVRYFNRGPPLARDGEDHHGHHAGKHVPD